MDVRNELVFCLILEQSAPPGPWMCCQEGAQVSIKSRLRRQKQTTFLETTVDEERTTD